MRPGPGRLGRWPGEEPPESGNSLKLWPVAIATPCQDAKIDGRTLNWMHPVRSIGVTPGPPVTDHHRDVRREEALEDFEQRKHGTSHDGNMEAPFAIGCLIWMCCVVQRWHAWTQSSVQDMLPNQ